MKEHVYSTYICKQKVSVYVIMYSIYVIFHQNECEMRRHSTVWRVMNDGPMCGMKMSCIYTSEHTIVYMYENCVMYGMK